MARSRLASVFALRLALTLAAAMLAYAVLQRALNPDMSWTKLAVEHGAHVLSLGPLLYVVLLVGFDRVVGRPLRIIHAHLYKIATGRLEFLHLDTRVREIAEMEASVNLMVRRMRLGAGDADPHRTALALRDLAARIHKSAPAASEAMVNAAAALEVLAPEVKGHSREVPAGTGPGHTVTAHSLEGAREPSRVADCDVPDRDVSTVVAPQSAAARRAPHA